MTTGRDTVASSELVSRALTGGLFLALTWRLGLDFARTQRPTDLLMVVGAALVVIMTCLRRSAYVVDRRPLVRFVTALSVLVPLMVAPGETNDIVAEKIAVPLIGIGLIIVLGGKLSLGRSFGLLPANRGVMDRGLYKIVRHPIYLGYLIIHIGFLAAHPSGWNISVLLMGDIALIVRALYEEHTLGQDPKYVQYCQTVRWRIIPGVC